MAQNHGMSIFASIVSLFEANTSQTPVNGRLAAALLILFGMSAWPFWFALSEPSLGIRLQRVDSKTIEISQSRSASAKEQALTTFRAPEARLGTHGAEVITITPQLLLETSGMETYYNKQVDFHVAHAHLWKLLHQPSLTLYAGGQSFDRQPQAKRLQELGLRFWWPWAVSGFSLAVALAVWVFSPNRRIAALYLMIALGYSYIMGMLASNSSRLLTQAPIWSTAITMAHIAGYVMNCGLCLICWRYPRPLGSERSEKWFLLALLLWSGVWFSIDFLHRVETISTGFRLPLAALGLTSMALLFLQWRGSRGLPLERSQLKWLIFLCGISFGLVLLAYLYALQPDVQIEMPQAYGFSFIALLFFGLIPLATRLKMFELEAWWGQVWVWLLGGLLVVLIDIALIQVLRLSSSQALVLAVAAAGWLYFPLRQWAWKKIAGQHPLTAQHYLPQIVELISQTPDSASLRKRWLDLWESVMNPRSIELCETSIPPGRVTAQDLGRQLVIPALGTLPELTLHLAQRGTRLFNSADIALCQSLFTLAEKSLLSQEAFALGADLERQRIAADLHDDLGAKLLTLTQSTSSAEKIPELARQALQEMRLSVRGLNGVSKALDELVADWRREIVDRLTASGIELQWNLQCADPAPMLSARHQVQLTRILREVTNNLIAHSRAKKCEINLISSANHLEIRIQDDGQGFDVKAAEGQGLGLAGLERRVRSLSGQFQIASNPISGTCVDIQVPLSNS
jgi:signal transduction histidine kinase